MATPSTRAGFTQIASLFFGSTLIGLGVALFVRADLGVPAYDVMLTAIRDRFGVSLGQAGWLFTGLLFLVATALGQRPRPIAVAYILGNGLAVDTFMQVVRQPDDLVVRLGFVGLGTMIIAAAVALVTHAGLGGGATELLMRAGESRGLNPFRVRTALEITIVTFGVFLGGSFGPATVFFVLTISPILQAGRRALDDHRTGRRLRMQATTRPR